MLTNKITSPQKEEYDVRFSMGTNPALDTFRVLLADHRRANDLILINVVTLIRNKYEKGFSVHDLEKKVLIEMDDLLSELILAIENIKPSIVPTILLYMADYTECIPVKFIREPPPSRSVEDIVEKNFLKIITNSEKVARGGVRVIQRRIRDRRSVSHALDIEIAKHSKLKHILLWSHVPLDYHICHNYSHVMLIESFTGHTLVPKQFGYKVFKHEHLPFTMELHALLGDQVLLKSFLSVKEKRRLLQIAETEVWDFKTPSDIKSRLRFHNFLVPSIIV